MHRGIHHLQSSSHIWRTTSTQAYVSSCTHARTRKHPPSYTNHVANVCILWQVSLFREGEWEVVWEAENLQVMVGYVAEGNVRDQADNLWLSKLNDIFDHL